MTTIKLTCIDCGDVQLLGPEDMTLELDPDGWEGTYRFMCATCIQIQHSPAGPRIVTILLAMGVRVEVIGHDQITEQEIVAFVAALDGASEPLVKLISD
jgi:hypothetical protein